MRGSELADNSLRILLLNQHPSGSFVACPLFFHYAYCWLRDGTFTAYALDLAGEHAAALRFYRWAHEVIAARKEQIAALIARNRRGESIPQNDFLNTRYHLNGRTDDAPWGHFQLDGYAAWLWGLIEHIRMNGAGQLGEEFRPGVTAAVDYVQEFWQFPNFDCWEEHGDKLHPSTLACLYGGLRAAGAYWRQPEWLQTAEEIKRFVEAHAVSGGHFVKYLRKEADGTFVPDHTGVDGSLLWLVAPFGMFAPEHPVMRATLELIGAELKPAGVRRYQEDSYYGGGEWIILTAWYGLAALSQGDVQTARECLRWVEAQADEAGRLPEQVCGNVPYPREREAWIAKLGVPAVPLLWSHAMHLVLQIKLAASEMEK